jgi:site-specific DNA-methyltransferase (adenine-specific)
MPQLIQADCLLALREMPSAIVDLIYLDPPFFTQKVHRLKSRELEEYQFDDCWDSLADYLQFLYLRLQEIRRVMKDSASIFFHCDRTASHHIRLLLDEIFGEDQFRSEIIWTYRRWSNSQRSLLPAHQTIFMYSKSENYTFNTLLEDYSETTNLDQILQMRVRDEHGKTTYAKDETGEVLLNGAKKGVPLSDTWAIPYLNPKARERTGYPTQKPILLLERIVELASNPSEILLDPFCGSGTSLVAAKLLDRDYIGIDSSLAAIELSKKRLANPIKSDSPLLQKGREAYDNLPLEVKQILEALPVKPIQRNAGIDAIHNEYIDGKPVLIRIQRKGESLLDAANSLAKAGKKKQAALLLLIKTHEESKATLFDIPLPREVQVIENLALALQKSLHQP